MKNLFPDLDRPAMEARINNARLRADDRQIARMRLLDQEAWVDIGAAVHCDRRTASRRFDKIKDML